MNNEYTIRYVELLTGHVSMYVTVMILYLYFRYQSHLAITATHTNASEDIEIEGFFIPKGTSVRAFDLLIIFLFYFSVRLLSVLRGHSFFSSPPQRPMTFDFEGFSIPDVIHYIYFPILILEKEPVFPF